MNMKSVVVRLSTFLFLLVFTAQAWAGFCPSCGKEAQDSDSYCSGCGAPVNSQRQPKLQPSIVVNTPKEEIRSPKAEQVVFKAFYTSWQPSQMQDQLAGPGVGIDFLYEDTWVYGGDFTFTYLAASGAASDSEVKDLQFEGAFLFGGRLGRYVTLLPKVGASIHSISSGEDRVGFGLVLGIDANVHLTDRMAIFVGFRQLNVRTGVPAANPTPGGYRGQYSNMHVTDQEKLNGSGFIAGISYDY